MAGHPTDSTGFFFDVLRWRSSRDVHRMSMAERGVYLEMLLEQWERRSLPNDPQEVANTIAGNEAQIQEVLAAWPVVRRKFTESRGNPRLIFNPQLEETRKKQRENRQRRHEAGKVGSRARWGRTSSESPRQPSPSPSPAEVIPMPAKVPAKAPAMDARSKRPVYVGQRLTVFEWMFDDCCRVLGEHLDAFNIDAFFQQLDDRLVAENLVVPKRDGGQWLEAELVAEAQRRGIPLRYAKPQKELFGKQTTRMAALVQKYQDEE